MNYGIYTAGREISEAALEGLLGTEAAGVFESLRTYGDCLFLEEEHLDRLIGSARSTGFSLEVDSAVMKKELAAAIKAYRCKESLSGRARGEDLFIRYTLAGSRRIIVVGRRQHPERLYREGVSLMTAATRKSLSHAQLPEAKTNAYLNQILGTLDAGPDAYEVLFLDRCGLVSEVRIGNIFITKKGTLLTPPPRGILNGVTRLFVIKCAFLAGIRVREEPLTRHDIYNADEAFLTNTSWEILPVRSLDNRKIGKSLPGAVTETLQGFFKKGVNEYARRKNPKSTDQRFR